MEVLSLYCICLHKISKILVECQEKVLTSDNPFQAFPPKVVRDLILYVVDDLDKTEEYLKCSYLYLLLISGRITSLKFSNVYLKQEDSEEIFNCLQPYSEKLKSIRISRLHSSASPKSLWTSSNFRTASSNFGTLLHSAKNLVSLETNINFNLSELSHCKNLERLILNFIVRDLPSFLYVDGKIRHNYSLKMLRILKLDENEGLCFDIALILQYCVEIVEIDYNIAPSLGYLHRIKKATKYKLQKTRLGESREKLRILSKAVRIASLYCPELREVKAVTSGYAAVRTFSNFSQITRLNLDDPEYNECCYDEGVGPLLQNPCFGHKLKSLVLRYFYRVDFPHIGACCPNLEELTVGSSEFSPQPEFIPNSFQKLISLCMEDLNETFKAESLIGILSKATFLEFLKIDPASNLNDTTLDSILENTEAFSRLKTLNVNECGLSITGLKKLVHSMVAIQFVLYSSSVISLEDTENVLKSMDIARYNVMF